MNSNVCSAMLLGNSFIRRLNDFLKDNPSYYNLRLYENLFDIRCRVQGGLTVFRLIHERYDLCDFGHFTPTIIYSQIGGSDISKPGISSGKSSNDIVSLPIIYIIVKEFLLLLLVNCYGEIQIKWLMYIIRK